MSEQKKGAAAVAEAQPQRATNPKILPPYNVVLLDDNDHTYDYVILMLMRLFGRTKEDAELMAYEVDTTGRVIVDTTTKERAELKQEQIHAFGPDPDLEKCAGSMSAIIEPCPR
ncbi:MAG: ATP-dependent Clp protease adaptor ClpS [Phycisphaerales bacterium]|nr:ATP-dependent Clp protease adaptor ClpS [Phycisphaerales bacterium]